MCLVDLTHSAAAQAADDTVSAGNQLAGGKDLGVARGGCRSTLRSRLIRRRGGAIFARRGHFRPPTLRLVAPQRSENSISFGGGEEGRRQTTEVRRRKSGEGSPRRTTAKTQTGKNAYSTDTGKN